MAQIKKKAPAGTSNNSTQPSTIPDGLPLNRQAEETNPLIEDVTTKAGLHGGPVEDDEATEALQTQSAELTEIALQLKAHPKEERNHRSSARNQEESAGPGKQASRG